MPLERCELFPSHYSCCFARGSPGLFILEIHYLGLI
jgi:hypothetical protein